MYWIQYETAFFTATGEYKMILKNADIFDSEFALRRADVRVEDGKIAEIGENLNGGSTIFPDALFCPALSTYISTAAGERISPTLSRIRSKPCRGLSRVSA